MKEGIRTQAIELGFDACRFTSAAAPETGPALMSWLEAGRHGQMEWLRRNAAKRVDPNLVLPGAKSVLVLATSYFDPHTPQATARHQGFVARYARHADYHDILAEKLKALAQFLDALSPGSRSLWYVDTGPLLERDLAQRAGVGFVGKHTNLISRSLGNWILLSEIITTIELQPDLPEKNRCGSCSLCIGACPTAAIVAPFNLDARRCISYLTIELKGSIPVELRQLIGNRIFGCDDCLAVCPWNRFAREGNALKEHRHAFSTAPNLRELLSLDEPSFKQRFAGTPVLRTKRKGLLRNVCVALGNTGGPGDLDALEKAALDPEPLISEHAAWAIAQIRSRMEP